MSKTPSNSFFHLDFNFYFSLFSGQRRSILFQYEMGTSEIQINQLIDNLLNDWSKIVYLYYLVHNFGEQIKSGE